MVANFKQSHWRETAIRLLAVVAASLIFAINLKSFVQTGDLFPGGFSGVTRLIQRSALKYAGVELPYGPINLLLNAVPAFIGWKMIGKRFTLTYAGHCLLNGGTEILRLRDDLQGKMEEIVHGDKGQLKVGFPYIRGITLLPPVLKEYKRLHPQVDIQVY